MNLTETEMKAVADAVAKRMPPHPTYWIASTERLAKACEFEKKRREGQRHGGYENDQWHPTQLQGVAVAQGFQTLDEAIRAAMAFARDGVGPVRVYDERTCGLNFWFRPCFELPIPDFREVQ